MTRRTRTETAFAYTSRKRPNLFPPLPPRRPNRPQKWVRATLASGKLQPLNSRVDIANQVALGLLGITLLAPLIAAGPAPVDMDRAAKEVSDSYGKAHPEVQEFILHTARSFGRDKLWLNDNAFAALTPEEREAKIEY